MKKFFIVMMSLIISSCATPPRVWHKAGSTLEEFYQTNYTCLQQSQQPESNNIFAPDYPRRANAPSEGPQARAADAMMRGFERGYNAANQHETGMRTNNLLFSSCMHTHGFFIKEE